MVQVSTLNIIYDQNTLGGTGHLPCMFYLSLMSTLKKMENLNFAPPCFLVFSYSKQVYSFVHSMLEHTIVILTRNVRYLFLVKILSANICVLFLR